MELTPNLQKASREADPKIKETKRERERKAERTLRWY